MEMKNVYPLSNGEYLWIVCTSSNKAAIENIQKIQHNVQLNGDLFLCIMLKDSMDQACVFIRQLQDLNQTFGLSNLGARRKSWHTKLFQFSLRTEEPSAEGRLVSEAQHLLLDNIVTVGTML